MTKKGKIVLAIVIVLAIIVGLLIYFVSRDLSVERELKEEIKNYHNSLVENKEIDKENIVTTGDYAIVEKALKEYLSDCNTHYNDLNNVVNDQQINNNLTVQNIEADGPNFTATKQYFIDISDRLSNAEEVYLNDFEDKTIMSYIEDETVSDYYKDFYYDLATNEDVMISEKNDFDSSIDKLNNILNKQEEMIDFLITNQLNWRIMNGALVFFDNNLATTYNTYTEELNKLTEG